LAEALGHHPDIAFHIVDGSGTVLFSTAPALLREHARSQPIDAAPRRHDWILTDGRCMHALHLRQTLADGSQLVTLLAIDDNRHADFLQRFRHLLAIAIIGAAVASSLLGGYVVRRTLRPLRTLADEARQITAGRLQRRLSARSAPAELEQLAQTLNGMLARLQQDFARLTEFSGDLAHELRTPSPICSPRCRWCWRTRAATRPTARRWRRVPRNCSSWRRPWATCCTWRRPRRRARCLARAGGAGWVVDSLLEFYEPLAEDRQLTLRREGWRAWKATA
jgi:two-component system heavy metal sensor histidine kinase CusS